MIEAGEISVMPSANSPTQLQQPTQLANLLSRFSMCKWNLEQTLDKIWTRINFIKPNKYFYSSYMLGYKEGPAGCRF